MVRAKAPAASGQTGRPRYLGSGGQDMTSEWMRSAQRRRRASIPKRRRAPTSTACRGRPGPSPTLISKAARLMPVGRLARRWRSAWACCISAGRRAWRALGRARHRTAAAARRRLTSALHAAQASRCRCPGRSAPTYFREKQYGLVNQSFGAWAGRAGHRSSAIAVVDHGASCSPSFSP